jgi:hypothetical protein
MKYFHEKSIENLFRDSFSQAARGRGDVHIAASLDGQDRIAGADYLFTNSARYAIVEFKDREKNLKSEIRKAKRHLLCQALHSEPDALTAHRKCHFAAWGEESNGITIKSNVYYNEVCNADFWGSQFEYINNANHTTRTSGNDFIDRFLSGEEGADIHEFDAYIAWLLQLGDDSNTSGYLELLISNPYDRRSAGLSFKSVRAMHTWVENHRPAPSNTCNPNFEAPSGP